MRPNFLYIGPDKAGSSWLHEVLLAHPEIYLTPAKDLYFFDRYYDRGAAWYLGQFRQAQPQHRVIGEVCQDYLFHPQAAARIHEVLGDDTRLMVTLRDPVDRAFSSYLYMLKHGEDEGTFREALSRRPELVEHSSYGASLSRYLTYFDRERIHVAVFDDLAADHQVFIDDVLSFLGVAPMVLDEQLAAARLPASRSRSAGASRAVRTVANWVRLADGAELVGKIKRSPLVHKVLYVPYGDDKPTPSPEDVAYLRDLLAADVALLSDLVGIDLPSRWGWDRALPEGASGT
jgi:hypothetical protein